MITKELRLEAFDPVGMQYPLHGRNGRVSKSFYGGEDMSLSFELDRDPRINYRDVAYGNDVILRRGLNPVFKGEMRNITQGQETLTIGCPGQWIYLDDQNAGNVPLSFPLYEYKAQRLWCDNRYKKWVEVNGVRAYGGGNYRPEKWEIGINNWLYLAPRKGEVFGGAAGSYGAVSYTTDVPGIARVSFDYDIDLGWATNWALNLTAIDPLSNSIIWTPAAGTTGTGVFDGSCLVFGRLATVLLLEVRITAGPTTYTGETGENVYVKITNMRVWGQSSESHSSIHVMEAAIDEVAPSTPIDASHDLALEEMPVRDLFTDPNATLLTAHLPDRDQLRGMWQLDVGGFNIQGNQANNTVNQSRAYINSGISDGVIAVDVVMPAAGLTAAALLFRWQDGNNYWRWQIRGDTGFATLARVLAGVQTTPYNVNIGIQMGYTYHLMVKLRGDEIRCYIGGILRTTVNDGNMQTATRHGLATLNATAQRFDNFEVSQMLPLWPLFYEEGESCYGAVKDAASFGDWNYRALGWGIEPGGDRAFLRVANRESVRYVIPAQFCRQLSTRGETQGAFYTSGWGRYIDEEGITRFTAKYYVHVTNAGLEINTTATGNDLASTIYGVDRDHTFDFGRVDAELAVQYLIQSLKEQGHPKVQTSIEVFGPVKDLQRGGASIEPIEMEMGYLVQIPYFRATEAEGAATVDLRDFDTTLLIVGMEVDLETGVAKLIPEGAQEDLSRMIRAARAVVEQDEKRLTSKRSRVVGG